MGQSLKQYKTLNHKQFSIKEAVKYRRYYKTFIVGSGAFLLAFLISSVFAPVQNSDASTVHITNNTSDYFIDITSADSLSLDVTASPGGQLAYAADKINVTTNSENGYKLYVSTSGNDNNIYAGGSSATSGQGYFSPSSGNISSPTTLTQNTWGFALNKSQTTSISSAFANVAEYVNDTGAPTTSSTWAAVPTFANSDQAKISELSGSSNTPNGTDLDIYYGINASTSLPSGDYSTTVTYTAVSEGVNVFDTMQDFTVEKCYNMATNSSINLTDSRDGKHYRVTKMKDGHCWMTDNLALDGTDKAGNVRVLTPSDSDVTSSVGLAENIGEGVEANPERVQIYSGIADQATTECDPSYEYCVENPTTKYGNLYNWFAATARSGTSTLTTEATMSICPKGWRLPSDTGGWSYGNLLRAYGVGNGENVEAGEIGGEYVRIAQQSPLYFALAGDYLRRPLHQGQYAFYMTRTPVSDEPTKFFRLHLDAGTGEFSPLHANTKMPGFSVRCVFSGSSSEYIQNWTATMCNNLAVNTTTTLMDKRNGVAYKVVHAKDGHCWMADDLAIYGQTIAAEDSDFSSGTFTIPTSSPENGTEWNTNVYTEPRAHVVTETSVSNYDGDKTPFVGNVYYNWTAAVALEEGSTSEQQDRSICPKNWQLPVVGADDTVDKSYTKLFGATYGYNITLGNAELFDPNNPAYVLGFRYVGYYNFIEGMEHLSGTSHFWTSTPYGYAGSYDIGYTVSDIWTGNLGHDKGYGFNVRCVAR